MRRAMARLRERRSSDVPDEAGASSGEKYLLLVRFLLGCSPSFLVSG
jgi:hypothetical protein